MAHHGRVPQFGKWDCSNPQFTMTFEIARKGRVAGTKIMPSKDLQVDRQKLLNPIEPAGRNAEASKFGLIPKEQHQFRKGHIDHKPPSNHHKVHQHSVTSPAPPKPDHLRTNMIQKHKIKRHDQSLQRHQTRERADEVHHPFLPMAQYANIQQGCTGNKTGPSVPKFGAWNMGDHAELARGYTVIFDEVKGKKHKSAGIMLASLTDQPALHPAERTKKKRKNVSIWAMINCCFSPSVKV